MKILKRIRAGIGVTWAILCIVAVLATFVGLGFWERTLATGTGIHVSPRFSGGEVRRTVDHGAYRTLQHRPVFDGLVGERAEGFVQIDWVPQESGALPPALREEFDIDGDGSIDCNIRMDNGKPELLDRAPWVLGIDPLIEAGAERILRVRLRNPNR